MAYCSAENCKLIARYKGLCRNHWSRETDPVSESPEYLAWINMKSRCYNPKNIRYANYGARGIKVCDEWIHSFSTFLSDVGKRPSPNHSIDRINNDGDYELGNIRWATRKEQALNRSSNRFLTYEGKTKHLGIWAEELGIKRTTLTQRLNAYGWSIEKALTAKGA